MNTRLLGILGMVGAPMLLMEGIYTGFQRQETDQLIGVLGLVYTIGWFCSLIGLRRLNATGSRAIGKGILVVQLVGVALAIGWALIYVANPNPNKESLVYTITDLAWPLSHVFMLVVGIAALVAGRLRGWQRFTPLLCGLALPVAIIAGIAGGESASGYVFPLWTTTAFGLLGYTVYTSGRETSQATLPAPADAPIVG